MSIALIVPFYNEEKDLESCICSILAQSQLPDEVLFVDNGSTDQSRQIATDYASQFKVPVRIFNERNKGIPYVRNRGIRKSKTEKIAFLDSDCIAPPRYIELLVKGFEQDVQAVTGRYVLVGSNPALAQFRQQTWEQHFGWKEGARIIHSLDDQSGALISGCSAFDKQALLSLGLYNPKFVYMDDIAISEIFYQRGYRARMDPQIEVQHKIDTSESSIFRTDLHYGFDHALINLHIRGKRIRFYPKHYKLFIRNFLKVITQGDQLAFYQIRTLIYHKLGLLMKGLTLGGIYL